MRLTKLKIFRIIAVSLLVLAGLLLSAVALIVNFYPKETMLRHLTAVAEQGLKRRVTASKIDYSFKGVLLHDVAIYDGVSVSDPLLAKSREVELKFSLRSLIIDKKLIVDSILLRNGFISITYDDKEKSSLERFINDVIKDRNDKDKDTIIEQLNCIDTVIELVNPPLILKPLEGRYSVTADILFNADKSLNVTNCRIRLPQDRGVLNPELTIIPMNNNFKIKGKVKLHNASLNWVYQWGKNATLPYQIINGDVIDLVITKDMVRGHAIATSTLRKTSIVLTANGFCQVNIPGETVLISDAKGSMANSTFILQKMFFTFSGKIIQFDVNSIDAQVQEIRPILDFLPEQLNGKVMGRLSFSGNKYNGHLELAGVSFNKKDGLVTDLNTQITIKNNMFKKKDIPVTLLHSPCFLSIATTDDNFKRLFIDVRAEKFVVDENKMSGAGDGRPVSIPLEINGGISIGQLVFNAINFSNVKMNYSISKNIISFQNFSTKYIGGLVTGKGSIDLGQVPPKVSVAINLENIKIQNTDIVKEKLTDRLFGSLNGKALLNFRLSKNLAKTLNGNVEVKINNGKLVNTGIQNGLGLFLSELKYKLDNLEFKTIYGNLSIEGDNYKVNSIIFNSENVRLKIEGSFDAKLVASPLMINLEFNKHFIRDLPGPVALGLNKYATGPWYVIPFSCEGDITKSKNIKRLR